LAVLELGHDLRARRGRHVRGHAPAVHLPRLEERILADVVRIGQRFETYGGAVAPRPGVPTKPPSPARRALRRAVAVVRLYDLRRHRQATGLFRLLVGPARGTCPNFRSTIMRLDGVSGAERRLRLQYEPIGAGAQGCATSSHAACQTFSPFIPSREHCANSDKFRTGEECLCGRCCS
jgi:hypothetical protein